MKSLEKNSFIKILENAYCEDPSSQSAAFGKSEGG